jgi:hypothetical protein
MTTTDPQVAYEFGQFTLVPTEKRLLCDGKVVPLAPKVFDTLVLLVKNRARSTVGSRPKTSSSFLPFDTSLRRDTPASKAPRLVTAARGRQVSGQEQPFAVNLCVAHLVRRTFGD